ncbi:MAG: tRNA 4-thiouridine(8) synthase ThiI [Candidatus Omnitrophota bacterium]
MDVSKNIKAVALFSGGLDSSLAIKLVKDQGIDVYGLHCVMPWGEGNLKRCERAAEKLGIVFHPVYLGNEYFDMLKNPRHGYGRAINPCIDCHRYMVIQAGRYMAEIGAKFLFSGEVIGQRPMSQRKAALPLIERDTGLEGLLLRPLSAQRLPETIPERQGLIDRTRLLDISGRSRKKQFALAEEWGITDFANPAGGCLLTEKHFAGRMRDFLSFPYHDARESAVLCYGRYLRLDHDHILIVGRNQTDNQALREQAYADDWLLKLKGVPGPTALLKGLGSPDEELLARAAGAVQWFSKCRGREPMLVSYTRRDDPADPDVIQAAPATEEEIEGMLR